MKETKKLFSILLVMCISVILVSGCNNNALVGAATKKIIYNVIGEEPKEMGVVQEEINKIIKKELNAEISFRFLNNQNYDLILSSGEKFDLIYAPDWLSYWENAEKMAFAEITDADLQKFAPNIYNEGKKFINSSIYKGKRYAIPAIYDQASDRCYLVRGDLMNKYGIEAINNVNDFERYLDAVAKNEPDLIPFDASGTYAFQTAAMFVNDWGWISPGTVSCSAPVFIKVNDPSKKLFIAVEQPEMIEFTKRMKRWYENGYFSKSALSNKITSIESFKNGRSASAYASNPQAINAIYNDFKKDDRAQWDVRGYPICSVMQPTYNHMNMAVAISAFSENKELCLKIIDLIYNDEKIFKFTQYGINGVHYQDLGNGIKEDIDRVSFGSITTGIMNEKYILNNELDFPNSKEVVVKLKETLYYDPLVNLRKDLTNIREISVAIENVYNKYTAPRLLGFVGDPEKAIEDELSALKKAGIDTYVEVLQKQINEFIANSK